MALLTNNVREWEPLWRSMLPVDEIFELVVDSAFVGMRKPDPPIYELTIERLGDGIAPRDCLFVDDVARQRRGRPRARDDRRPLSDQRAGDPGDPRGAELTAAPAADGATLRREARCRRRGGVQAGASADHVRGDGRAARHRDPHRAARRRQQAATRAPARRRARDLALDPAPGADDAGADRAPDLDPGPQRRHLRRRAAAALRDARTTRWAATRARCSTIGSRSRSAPSILAAERAARRRSRRPRRAGRADGLVDRLRALPARRHPLSHRRRRGGALTAPRHRDDRGPGRDERPDRAASRIPRRC